MSRVLKPDSGQSLVLQDEGGSAALTIDTSGNTVIADGQRIQTDEIRAYDGAGLKLYDDSGTAGIFVDDGGNVGIGVTPESTWKSTVSALQLGGTGAFYSATSPGAGGAVNMMQNAYWDNTNNRLEYIVADEATRYYQADGTHVFLVATSGAAPDDPISWTTALTLDNSGNATISGSLSKGSGSFKIDHPLESKSETHNLVHSFIEGPQADLIYRGKVNLVDGSATINIDTEAGMTEGTFSTLCASIQCFTTNETGWSQIIGTVEGNILTITANSDTCVDSISWMVIGERKDKHILETEWTDENGKVIVEPEKPIIDPEVNALENA